MINNFKANAALRLRLLLSAIILLLPGAAARAWIVAATGTTVNPASYPGWTDGDPGWDNLTVTAPNYVYLGNGWALTARHEDAGTNNLNFSTGTFSPIAGQNFVIHNPPPSLAGGVSLSTETDLRLIRLNGDPGLPALTIASQSPPLSGTNGSQVMFIGQGGSRLASETNWQVDMTNPNSWVWTVVASSGNFKGYQATGPSVKHWGTNRLANPGSAAYQSVFTHILNSTDGVFPIRGGDLVNRDVITMLSSFDQQGQAGALPYEAQAIGGNSGSAVFYKNGAQWQLAGIVNTILTYNNQSTSWGVYGDATTFTDLSYYNKAYQGSICDVMKTCGNYSTVGDVNLDGLVSGDGTGPAQTDDVTAFVAGWNYNNGAGAGDYLSWTHGDLNHDGKTDVSDFLLIRNALNGQISGAALTSIFGTNVPQYAIYGGSPVPEPSVAVYILLAAAFLVLAPRHGRRIAASL